jgi:polar amino acid transport system substrate-binding protein
MHAIENGGCCNIDRTAAERAPRLPEWAPPIRPGRGRRKVARVRSPLVVVLAAALLLAGCNPGQTTPYGAGLVQTGTLTACVAPLGPPAAGIPFSPTGEPLADELVGYNVDIAAELAHRLDLAPRIVETPFAELLEAVAGHRCDVSVSSQNITASRSEVVDFVPYTRASQRVLVAHDNPLAIDTIDGLCGRLVSATSGSIMVDMVEGSGDFAGYGLSQACLASGRQPIEVQRYPDHEQAVQALLDGAVAAHLGNSNFVFRFPDRLAQSPATLPAARQGIGVAMDRPALRDALAEALAAMIDDGAYHAILLEHLGSEERVRAGSIAEPGDASTEVR